VLWALFGLPVVFLTSEKVEGQEFASSYTSSATKNCRKVQESKPGEGDWVIFSCPGQGGLLVRLSEDDLRQSVSVGRTLNAAAQEPAATQTFGTFNSTHDTIEWRGPKGGAPVAVIQRWRLADPEKAEDARAAASLLVVTRVPPGPVCHVAYVDAKTNRDANNLARRAAEQIAAGFRCGAEPVRIVGTPGRGTQLATGR
jgi:hypothetical protein